MVSVLVSWRALLRNSKLNLELFNIEYWMLLSAFKPYIARNLRTFFYLHHDHETMTTVAAEWKQKPIRFQFCTSFISISFRNCVTSAKTVAFCVCIWVSLLLLLFFLQQMLQIAQSTVRKMSIHHLNFSERKKNDDSFWTFFTFWLHFSIYYSSNGISFVVVFMFNCLSARNLIWNLTKFF